MSYEDKTISICFSILEMVFIDDLTNAMNPEATATFDLLNLYPGL